MSTAKLYRAQLGSREHADRDQIVTVEIINKLRLMRGFYLCQEAGNGRLLKIERAQFVGEKPE